MESMESMESMASMESMDSMDSMESMDSMDSMVNHKKCECKVRFTVSRSVDALLFMRTDSTSIV